MADENEFFCPCARVDIGGLVHPLSSEQVNNPALVNFSGFLRHLLLRRDQISSLLLNSANPLITVRLDSK